MTGSMLMCVSGDSGHAFAYQGMRSTSHTHGQMHAIYFKFGPLGMYTVCFTKYETSR